MGVCVCVCVCDDNFCWWEGGWWEGDLTSCLQSVQGQAWHTSHGALSPPLLCLPGQPPGSTREKFPASQKSGPDHNWEGKAAGGHEISAGDHITGWSVGVRCGARRWLRDDVGEPGCPSPHEESVPQGGHRAPGLHLCSCTTPARGKPRDSMHIFGRGWVFRRSMER